MQACLVDQSRTRDLKAQFALATDVGCLSDLALAGDSLHDTGGWVASDIDRKGTAGNILVGVFNVDDVSSGLGGAVGDEAGSVLVVMAFDVSLAWTLNGEAQATKS